MAGQHSPGCHQVPAQVSFVVALQRRRVVKVSRPAMCTIPSFCTLLLLSLPQACNDTVHLPLMHASLICMAACDQQVGSWQAPTLGSP